MRWPRIADASQRRVAGGRDDGGGRRGGVVLRDARRERAERGRRAERQRERGGHGAADRAGRVGRGVAGLRRVDRQLGRAGRARSRPRRARSGPARAPTRRRSRCSCGTGWRRTRRHDLALARVERELVEALQVPRRLTGRARVLDVELRDLGAGLRAGVGHLDARRVRPVAVPGDRQRAVAERRVGEPVAEREQRRLAVGVVVAVADQDALVEDLLPRGRRRRVREQRARERRRRLPGTLRLARRPRLRQPPVRARVAEQQRGRRAPELVTGVPTLEHTLDLAEPRHQHRAARVEDDDRVRVRRRDRVDQPVLGARERQRRAVDALAGRLGSEHDGDLRGACRGDRVGDQLVGRGDGARRGRVRPQGHAEVQVRADLDGRSVGQRVLVPPMPIPGAAWRGV